MSKEQQDTPTFTNEELEKMLLEKQIEANQAREELTKLQGEHNKMITRSLKVHQQNELLQASPDISTKMAEMKYQLAMAEQFIKSGAFPKMSPEQAYTIIKAGQEMSMQPVEAMQTLYIVNGSIKSYGDKMIARVLKHGYRVEYLNEDEHGLDVRIYHPDESVKFDVTENVSDKDQILQRSKAIGFAKKNKMRFHGIRMIVSFHLPHLFLSTTDEFTAEYNAQKEEIRNNLTIETVETKKESARLLEHIEKAETVEGLNQVYGLIERYGLTSEYHKKFDSLLNKSNHEEE